LEQRRHRLEELFCDEDRAGPAQRGDEAHVG
jgi:hypothetical protein